jgi:SagB-type dehydrogenase family enzyme
MTVVELGEFLYRAARIKRRFHSGNEEHITRPFPAAGGLYEIEFYLVINKCEGLASNLYRYDGVTHSLELVANANRDTQEMLEDGIRSTVFKGEPHVLLILAARFLRVNWKYESIAYSLILKNVGVIYQTMYLVATAMGLGGCALGGGNALSFGRATGLGYWEESAVGEFLLGRPAETLAVTGENGS